MITHHGKSAAPARVEATGGRMAVTLRGVVSGA